MVYNNLKIAATIRILPLSSDNKLRMQIGVNYILRHDLPYKDSSDPEYFCNWVDFPNRKDIFIWSVAAQAYDDLKETVLNNIETELQMESGDQNPQFEEIFPSFETHEKESLGKNELLLTDEVKIGLEMYMKAQWPAPKGTTMVIGWLPNWENHYRINYWKEIVVENRFVNDNKIEKSIHVTIHEIDGKVIGRIL